MKSHFVEVTFAAAGALVFVAAMQHVPVMDLIVESALSGGNISARATSSLGDIAANFNAPAH